MKKRFSVIFVFFLLINSLFFAQNSASAANRNTALRCLRLAENCLVGGDWGNAYRQAELGLSYDDSISDLIYVKAASASNLSYTRRETLDIIREAFKKDNWLGYSQNGARILYADLLCDTGDYEASLELLDSEPFILSADAEFIRVKNYYRMGTQKSVSDARLKVNTARRIYPSDVRFPTLFFMFEYAFMSEAQRNGLYYEPDETVGIIARAYIAKLPDYSNLDSEVEILASFFADDAEKIRLLKAIDSKNSRSHPLMAIAGLRNGIYTDEKAYDLFFSSAGDVIPLDFLQDFTLSLTDPEVKLRLASRLMEFSGTITVDTDLDLQNELQIRYEGGRPSSLSYDYSMDGFADLSADCDYGTPYLVAYPNAGLSLTYTSYPEVSRISYAEEGRAFTFLHDDFFLEPLEFSADSVFSSLGIDFYVPQVNQLVNIPSASEVVDFASAVEVLNTERMGGRVVYSSEQGRLYFANFYDGDVRYAYADFSAGVPFLRYVDTDGDGLFETCEVYDEIPSGSEEGFSPLVQSFEVERIFGDNAITSNIYLKELKTDRNANTFYEYSEQYFEYGGKMCSWDYDDNGTWDYLYIKSPVQDGNSLYETYVFCDNNANPALTINFIDGVPVKLTYNSAEEVIYAGKTDGFYWIAQEGSEDMEALALKTAGSGSGMAQGEVSVTEFDGTSFSVIRVGNSVFAKIIEPLEVDDADSEEE